ncbi:MAG: L-alanine-DL-glutamate epimerase, partial [Clostridiaceae bacterium]|nr:L-alanine-DL-glutamate epimerase [Clostridiaceae bacterium]
NNIALFCADLTVTPLLVEINKNYASRLLPVPGMKIGIIESNGPQNYVNWVEMMAMHPLKNHLSVTPVNGIFQLNDDYHKKSGGIFL